MALGIYIHLPFCRVHCAYCAFAVSTKLGLQDDYTTALVREIEERATGERADTIFFGGGTPSRTSRENLSRVAGALRKHFDIDKNAEFSLEANPEDVTPDAIHFWQTLGVNRLSIGVQSFHDAELRPLGRVHGRERALAALRDAAASGIRMSLDLILGLPNQTPESFRETLGLAIASGARHLSLYMLDLEEGSALARRGTPLPDEDEVASLYVEAIERLGQAGLRQYEISNFGDPCLHNLRYWRREPYLGFGLGAHSFAGERRFANTRDIARYIAGRRGPELDESLGPAEQRRETLFLHLRQSAGIAYDDVVRLCGEEGIEWIARGLHDGWLRRDGARVAFTPAGFLLSNSYLSQLF
jgi:oxygen-independent coproporphyrinogen-3 oxidase